jgi:hypothetical protein
LLDASGYIIGGIMSAIEINSAGHFLDDDDDDSGGGTDGSGGGGGGSGEDDYKYNSPIYMITFPYL